MTAGAADEFRASFFEECEELLEAMNDGFGSMIDGTDDAETIHVIFRAVHSIKGGAGAFGLDALVSFAHHFETALDRVRSGLLEATDPLLDLCQRCGDHLSDLVATARAGGAVSSTDGAALTQQLDAVIGPETPAGKEVFQADAFEPLALELTELAPLSAPTATGDAKPSSGYCISFAAEPELFTSGNEPAHLFRALDRLGPTTVRADLDEVPVLSRLDPTTSSITWTIELEADISEDVVHDVFDFVSDCARLSICQNDREAKKEPAPPIERETPTNDTAKADRGPDPVSQGSVALKSSAATPITKATPPPQTIRVDFERVDKLINLVGELVIKEAMLSQAVGELELATGDDVLQEIEGLKQLAGEIQEGVMAIRAQPVKPLFQRMARTIRDASTTTGKKVRLVMRGEAAEVDKTVLERLVDPLNHMVRNAVDHGLEPMEDRLAAGKPAEGTLTLSAAHRSGRVIIEISDDGGGIDREKVRRIAEERGLVSPGASLTPPEIDALLFLPGFSLKGEVSELSGRGVGLDVVRSEISSLGGRLAISSELGKGTVFSISLPLTLAVLEGMVVEVAGQTMVVPITAIQETLHPSAMRIHTIGSGSQVLSIRDRLVPLADLGAMFGFRGPPADLEDHVLLVIETETGRRCALIVDRLQDQRQVVIKSLETNYTQVPGVAAATILGDGRIALIVDPEGVAGGIAPAPASLNPAPPSEHAEGNCHDAS